MIHGAYLMSAVPLLITSCATHPREIRKRWEDGVHRAGMAQSNEDYAQAEAFLLDALTYAFT